MELYIHIPFCMKKCDYCDFLSGPYDADIRKDYTKALCREIEYWGSRFKSRTINTIFIGGGTPSRLETKWLSLVMDTVRDSFRIHEDAEVTIEVNPKTVSKEDFRSYIGWGLNRLSIGLQSANDDELELLGRIHTYEDFLKTYDYAMRSGLYNINIDIMTGLPLQTEAKIVNTLRSVLSLKPAHVSCYSLMIEEGTPFHKRYSADYKLQKAGLIPLKLPTDDDAYYFSKLAVQMLEAQGLMQYEISNFAREGFSCEHNIGYWTGAEYLGVGLGAASLIRHKRHSNIRDIHEYIKRSEALSKDYEDDSPLIADTIALSKKDEIEEFMYLGLRMNCGILRSEFKHRFSKPIEVYYQKQLNHLKSQGLLDAYDGRIFLTERGMDISNRVLAEFLL